MTDYTITISDTDYNLTVTEATYTVTISSAALAAFGIGDLNDVDNTDIGDGKFLQYNATSGKHEYVSSSATVSAIEDIGDVTITSPTDNQVLSYDSATTTWTNQTVAGGVTSHTDLTDIGSNTHGQIDTHISDTTNPHSVTAAQLGVEEGADVTDATNVDAAGAAMESDFTTNTFLYAATAGVPLPKTKAETRAILNVEDGADVTDATNVAAAGAVMKDGTQSNNQVGVFTGDGTLEGEANLTYDGNTLEINSGGNNTGLIVHSTDTHANIELSDDTSTYPIALQREGEHLTLLKDGTGDVAIGGQTPTEKLDVRGSIITSGTLYADRMEIKDDWDFSTWGTNNEKINIQNKVDANPEIHLLRDTDGLVTVGASAGAASTFYVYGDISVSGTVDGIDIATDVAANTTHRGLTNNPHSVSQSDLGITTGISDGNFVVIDGSSVSNNDYALWSATGLQGLSSSGVKTDLSLNNVDNVQQMPLSYLSTATSLGSSDVLVPSQNAVKEYVDDAVVAGGSYNDEQAQDAIGTILTDSATIDFTYNDGTPSITAVTIDSGIDHDSLANTHNLTTDVDHATITNGHNLTTDIDHASITNGHNLTTDIDHNSITNNHNLTSDIDHNTITNNHNLTTDIDHDQLTNYDADEHFTEASISHTNITDIGTNTHAQIDTHISNTSNPHSVDNTDVGLSNVDNVQQMPLSYLSTSTSLGSSDVLVPSQNAVKEYVDENAVGLTPSGISGQPQLNDGASGLKSNFIFYVSNETELIAALGDENYDTKEVIMTDYVTISTNVTYDVYKTVYLMKSYFLLMAGGDITFERKSSQTTGNASIQFYNNLNAMDDTSFTIEAGDNVILIINSPESDQSGTAPQVTCTAGAFPSAIYVNDPNHWEFSGDVTYTYDLPCRYQDLGTVAYASQSTSAPTITPAQFGHIHVDTANEEFYVSVDNTASSDWVQLGTMKDVVDDTTPQLGGNLDLNAKGIILDSQTYGGGIGTGDLVYFDGTDWEATDADAEATSKGMLGITLGSTQILTYGVWTTSGLTAGDTYYISTTAGEITNTAPSATGDIVRIIGYAISTTQLMFIPDGTLVEI